MRWLTAVTCGSLLMTNVAVAQESGEEETEEPKIEVGTRAGVTFLRSNSDLIAVELPGGGPVGDPVIHLALFKGPRLMFEPQVGFRQVSNSVDVTIFNLALQTAYLFSGIDHNSMYGAGNVALQGIRVGRTSTEVAVGGAFGYRWLPRPSIALRLEGRYRYWTENDIDEYGVSIILGVVLN